MGIVFLAAWYMLHHTRLGRTSTRWAATKRQRAFLVSTSKNQNHRLFSLWSAGIAGRDHEVARLSSAQPTAGTGYELDALLRWFWAVRVWRAEKVALLDVDRRINSWLP